MSRTRIAAMAAAVMALQGLGFAAVAALSSKPRPAAVAAEAVEVPAAVAAEASAAAPALEPTISTANPAPVAVPQPVPAAKLMVRPNPAPTSTTTPTGAAPQPAPNLAVVTPPPAPAAPAPTTPTTAAEVVVPLCATPGTSSLNLAGMSLEEIAAHLAAAREQLANQRSVAPGATVDPVPCQTAFEAGLSLQQACGAKPVPESIDLTGLSVDEIKSRLSLVRANNDADMGVYNKCTTWYYTGN